MSVVYVEMGTCSKVHGIKGEFLFNLLNNKDSSLKNKLSIFIKPLTSKSSVSTDGETHLLESIRIGNKVIARLDGIDNRNLSEDMIPFSIWIRREDFKEITDDEVYLSDLVGLEVFDTKGVSVGKVENFYDNGAQPVLVINLDDSDNIELPFVEVFFPKVDVEGKKIVMNNPGLL